VVADPFADRQRREASPFVWESSSYVSSAHMRTARWQLPLVHLRSLRWTDAFTLHPGTTNLSSVLIGTVGGA